MPQNLETAIQFLETQWSSTNDNKIKGIQAEWRFEQYLRSPEISSLFRFIIPGGWIIAPGTVDRVGVPTHHRIAILPILKKFTWSEEVDQPAFAAQVLATTYFEQAEIKVYFAEFEPDMNTGIESTFVVPASRNYQIPYSLTFKQVSAQNLISVPINEVMQHFMPKANLVGMRAYALNRLDRGRDIWMNTKAVVELFWKEYARYYLQRQFKVSNADLDFFLVGNSGRSYPVEFKSKTVAMNDQIGEWFGIDIGPFAKLSYFVSLSNNMDALFVVEQVDDAGAHVQWWGIKFSDLLKGCSWVKHGGGQGMRGGASSTIKVPKAIFTPLKDLLPLL